MSSVVGYPLLVSWQKGWLRAPRGRDEVRLRDGRTLLCDLSDSTQRTMALGLYEPAETRVVTEILKPGDTFIDVGALKSINSIRTSRSSGGRQNSSKLPNNSQYGAVPSAVFPKQVPVS